MNGFTGRTAIVTGASGNLGAAVTRELLARGARVVAVERRPEKLEAALGGLDAGTGRLALRTADLNDAAGTQSMVDAAAQEFGGIDILVNTVGGYRAGTPVGETPLETWDLMMSLNARTAFVISRAVAPHMKRAGAGKIIHVAARAAHAGGAGAAAYSASKSAVLRLVESLSAELKPAVNVNCVVPGTIDTPQNREAMPKADFTRWVRPEAVADVILFLASDAARAVHGAAIPV